MRKIQSNTQLIRNIMDNYLSKVIDRFNAVKTAAVKHQASLNVLYMKFRRIVHGIADADEPFLIKPYNKLVFQGTILRAGQLVRIYRAEIRICKATNGATAPQSYRAIPVLKRGLAKVHVHDKSMLYYSGYYLGKLDDVRKATYTDLINAIDRCMKLAWSMTDKAHA